MTDDPGLADIRITFNGSDGSWSYVGKECVKVAKSEATMNLGWIDTGSYLEDADKGTILHEFGHAIGLLHEHQSPARPDALTLDKDGTLRKTSLFSTILTFRSDSCDRILHPLAELVG